MMVLCFTNPEVNKNINGVMDDLEFFVKKRIDLNHPDPL
ncbi:MAG TPA: hypothetical protein HPP54_04950 [Nitrospinae bacterium]|nr:hypothetical protein [Nitrospinota bacterium]